MLQIWKKFKKQNALILHALNTIDVALLLSTDLLLTSLLVYIYRNIYHSVIPSASGHHFTLVWIYEQSYFTGFFL